MVLRSLFLRPVVFWFVLISLSLLCAAPASAFDLTNGDDVFTNNSTIDNINGLEGNDTITNNGNVQNFIGSTYIDGGPGNDTIINSFGASVFGDLTGGDDNDTISNNGVVTGDIFGNAGNDSITNLEFGEVTNLDGGDGNDTINNYGYVEEAIYGGSGNDIITNTGTIDFYGIDGESGDDVINNSGYVEDFIYGGTGNDTITNTSTGEDGNDIIDNAGSVQFGIYGGDGDDVITNTGNVVNTTDEDENDDIDGGWGNDTIINYGTVGNDIYGGPGNDTIYNYGTVHDDVQGDDGDDTIYNSGIVGDDLEGNCGNDTIINSGSVGEDLEGGDGDDTVIIQGNSTVGRWVDGGDGTDTLIFENAGNRTPGQYINFEYLATGAGSTNLLGTWRYMGFTNSGGDNTLSGNLYVDWADISGGVFTIDGNANVRGATTVDSVLYVEGTLSTSPLIINSGAFWGGNGYVSGDVIIHGTVGPGNSIGTLHVSGDVTFESGSTYEAEIEADGDSDLIEVTGSVTINGGNVSTSLPRSLYPSGYAWTLITTTGGVTGSFDGVEGQPDSATLTLQAVSNADSVTLEIVRASYADLADSPGGRAVGLGLDGLVALAAGSGDDMESLLAALDWDYSADEIAEALDQLSPEMYDAFLSGSITAARMIDGAIAARVEARRQSSAFGLNAPQQTGAVQLAALDGTGAGGNSMPGQSAGHGWSVWAKALGGLADQEAKDGKLGYGWTGGGALLGADGRVTPWLTLGFLLGYTHADLDFSRSDYDGSSEGLHSGIYGLFAWEGLHLEAAFSYGRYDHDAKRPVSIKTLSGEARTDFDSQTWLGRLGLGYLFDLGGWELGPEASFSYLHLDMDSFDENGLDFLNYHIADLNEDYLSSGLGIKLAGKYQDGDLVLLPSFKLEWLYNFNHDPRALSVSFRDYPGAPFPVEGADPVEHALRAQIGLNLLLGERVSSYLDYSFTYSPDYQVQTLSLGLQISF